MRYLIQQMMAFLAVILTILLVIGIFFTQFTKETITGSAYKQLEGYSDTFVDNVNENGWTWEQSLMNTESVLKNQRVGFYLLDTDRNVLYPKKYIGSNGSNVISDAELAELRSNERITKLVKDNFSGKSTTLAVYIRPLFTTETDGTGKEIDFSNILIVYQPYTNIEDNVNSLTQNLFKGFIISSVVALFISYGLAQFQVNRINRIRKATTQIAEGNFDVHLEVKNNDELDDLAQDFNQMAVALKETNEEVLRQEERRRNFMADVAHEMRTPLTTINGLLEGLAYGAIPEAQKEKSINLMRNETNRLIRLVNENLDYEKIRTNQISIVIQKLNATEIMKSIFQQLHSKAEAAGNELILETSESVAVYADYDRFVQIMVNLLQNAIQFTQDGEIRVSITKGYLETIIKISDTGIGMDEKQVKNIWDRYYKADPSRKNTTYGESGLGLSIVDQLVRLHKGHIEVESELGQGTTFTVRFPDVDLSKSSDNT